MVYGLLLKSFLHLLVLETMIVVVDWLEKLRKNAEKAKIREEKEKEKKQMEEIERKNRKLNEEIRKEKKKLEKEIYYII